MKEKFWDITLVKPEEIEKHTQSGVTQSLEKFETQVNSKFNELSIKFDISMKTVEQNNIKLTTKFSNIVEHQNDLLIMIATQVQSTLALMHQNMIRKVTLSMKTSTHLSLFYQLICKHQTA